MELRLLGPIDLVHQGRSVDLGGPRKRIVLAMLGLNANRVVSIDQLVESVWNTSPPSTARNQVQICVSFLRRTLRALGHPNSIQTRPPGYQLTIDLDNLDLLRFDHLRTAARAHNAAGRADDAVMTLRAALGLWFGDAVSGVESDLLEREATRLEEQRLTLTEEVVSLDLALGRHHEVVAELRALIYRYPLRERPYELLMLALYRAGRQADALEICRRARRILIEDVGLEPGRALVELERAILNRDGSLEIPQQDVVVGIAMLEKSNDPAAAIAQNPAVDNSTHARQGNVARPVLTDRESYDFTKTPGAAAPVPRQIPATIADFTGRESQIATIKEVLTDDEARKNDFGVPVVAICGQGGSGKSSLALRAAHEVADHFPDGNLYSDLSSVGGDTTDQALARFLRALGVDGRSIPDTTVERSSLFRTHLGHRQVLIVLDGVSSEDDIRPLMPGNRSCGVIIASRTLLGGIPGIRWIDLPRMDLDQTIELLGRIIGPGRVAAEAQAATELHAFCEGLPLALRIAASRLASRPTWQIATLVDRLRDEARRLDELAHHGLELRSTIELTYRSLSTEAQRLLRLATLVPTKEFSVWTAASLLDVRRVDAEEILEALVDVQLLDVIRSRGLHQFRYRMHGLIHAFANEQFGEHGAEDEREHALDRMLGGWMALSEDAHRVEYGGDYTTMHGSAPRWRPADHDAEYVGTTTAMPWWEDERTAITAAIRLAADHGRDELAWDLALTSITLFEAKAYFEDWRDSSAVALRVCARTSNRTGEAAMRYALGTLALYQARFSDAELYFDAALETFTADHNEHGRALVLRNTAHANALQGHTQEMMAQYSEALVTMRRVRDRVSEAHILRNLASHALEEGRTDHSKSLLDEALVACEGIRCLRLQAQILLTYARIDMALGYFGAARDSLNRVVRFVRGAGDRIGEAHALCELGRAQLGDGTVESAQITLTQALHLAQEVGERSIEAAALVELGSIAGDLGRTEAAVMQLRDAIALAMQIGAEAVRARAETLLASVATQQAADTSSDVAADHSQQRPGNLVGEPSPMSNSSPRSHLLEPRPADL